VDDQKNMQEKRRSAYSERVDAALSASPSTVPVTAEPLSLTDRLRAIDRAMTADDLATLLQVSRLTIIRKAKKRTIPSFRIGACVRFDPKAIACWLKKHGVN
jgi:excisionase family DNA binding protein